MKRWSLVAVPAVVLAFAAFAPHSHELAAVATHRVQMLQQGAQYLFRPAALTIRTGDVVEFVNVSGFPHNVQFVGNRIPQGAADVLNRAMPNRLGPLQGPMLTQPNAVYTISFAGAPAGTYDMFCLPHQALGMTARITVR